MTLTVKSCAVVFGHWPVGIFWFYYTISNGMLDWESIIGGILYLAAFVAIFMLKIGYGVLDDYRVVGYTKTTQQMSQKRIRNLLH